MPSSGGSSQPRNRTYVSCIFFTAGRFFTRVTGEALQQCLPSVISQENKSLPQFFKICFYGMPCGMGDLSSPTKDGNCIWERGALATQPPEKSLQFFLGCCLFCDYVYISVQLFKRQLSIPDAFDGCVIWGRDGGKGNPVPVRGQR